MSGPSRAPIGEPPEGIPPVLRRLGLREGHAEQTRWMLLVLTLGAAAVVLPQALLAASAGVATASVLATLALSVGPVVTFRTHRQTWATEVVEALALGLFAWSATHPATILAVLLSRLLFRSLYGSRRAAVVRPLVYIGTLTLWLVLTPVLPTHPTTISPVLVVWAFPVILAAAALGQGLAAAVRTGVLDSRAEALHLRLGAELIGLTEPVPILEAGWRAATGLCEIAPGTRMAIVDESDGTLHATRTAGPFASAPGTIPMPRGGLDADVTHLRTGDGPSAAHLDEAAGAACAWAFLAIPDLRDRGYRAWIVVGAPARLPDRTVSSLVTYLNLVSLALGYARAHALLTAQATQDDLTGLRNRASFIGEITRTLGTDHDGSLSLLFVDLDDFKEVNDLFGHQVGDRLLIEVGRRLRDAAGAGAECARIGGDEFAVLLPGADATSASATASRITASLAETTHADGTAARVGACIGVVTADGRLDAEQLVHRADVAMYAAKSTGRSRVSVYEAGLPHRDAEQSAFEHRLAGAAEAGELVVHYQPVVALDDGRCTAVEALVRWQHPDRGLLSPDSFITTAERTGAIRSIGHAVLVQALQDTARWHREHPENPITVHVNVSALQLEDDALLLQVDRALEATGLPPDALVIEVTESMAIASPGAVGRLWALAERGVALAIDDFGTGYSALQTLRALPVRIVKIDRSFVAGSSHSDEDRAVTEAIVQMAQRLGLLTVAEGVEHPDQRAFLEGLGTTSAQGYLYRRPGTALEFTAWFDDHLLARDVVPAP